MKGLLTSTLTSLMFAMLLTTPAWAETSFSTLTGIPAQALTVEEMDKVVGSHYCTNAASTELRYACFSYASISFTRFNLFKRLYAHRHVNHVLILSYINTDTGYTSENTPIPSYDPVFESPSYYDTNGHSVERRITYFSSEVVPIAVGDRTGNSETKIIHHSKTRSYTFWTNGWSGTYQPVWGRNF